MQSLRPLLHVRFLLIPRVVVFFLSHSRIFFLFSFFPQLVANFLVFVSVNLVGLFVHNLMEHAQRKAFLDTRNCIAARLEMEDENEKLVSA